MDHARDQPGAPVTRHAATVPLWLAPTDDADLDADTLCVTPETFAAMLAPAPALPPGACTRNLETALADADLPAAQRCGGHVVSPRYMGRIVLAAEDERALRVRR